MFYGEEDSAFQNLPPEMIVEVLSLVDLKGKQSGRLVCRRWRWILDHPDAGLVCFKLTNEEMTDDSIRYLLKSQLGIHHLVFQDVKVTWPSMTYSRNKFPHIRKLTVVDGNSDESMNTILQYGCAQTESLSLNDCFSHFRLDVLSRFLSGMRWNHLTELTLVLAADLQTHWGNSVEKLEENNVKGMELIFKKARIPNLRALTMDLILGEDELPDQLSKLMSNFGIFLERHAKTLKELRLSLDLGFSSVEGENIFPNISTPLFSVEQQNSVARELKLECLDVSTSHFEALVHLVPPCVWKSDNLSKLNWLPIYWRNWNPPPGTIQSLIQRNLRTLTNVTTTFTSGNIEVDPFEILWLETCPHLRELTISNCTKFFGVKLQLPTVRKLHINLMDFDSFENMSTWISRTFRNLEAVEFSVCFTTVLQNLQFDWIQNMLILPKLREIRFGFMDLNEGLQHISTGPNLIQQYCIDKPRLVFREQRDRGREDNLIPSVACLIKILPTQNYD